MMYANKPSRLKSSSPIQRISNVGNNRSGKLLGPGYERNSVNHLGAYERLNKTLGLGSKPEQPLRKSIQGDSFFHGLPSCTLKQGKDLLPLTTNNNKPAPSNNTSRGSTILPCIDKKSNNSTSINKKTVTKPKRTPQSSAKPNNNYQEKEELQLRKLKSSSAKSRAEDELISSITISGSNFDLKLDKVNNPYHKCIQITKNVVETEKAQSLFGNSRQISYASASSIGKRPTMEDEHFFLKNIDETLNIGSPYKVHSMFGVFDGHCGSECAEFCRKNLYKLIGKNKHFLTNVETAFNDAFEACDFQFRAECDSTHKKTVIVDENYEFYAYSGCTATVCLLRNDQLIIANLGDTRCVMAHAGNAVQLTQDHKPTRKDERKRIEKYGGLVTFGRINGTLAVSRAFGDYEFKERGSELVSIKPELSVLQITRDSDFIIVACDGLWDVMSSQEAVYLVYQLLAQFRDAKMACEKLVETAISSGSMDNVTVILILLKELR
ncbi:hypothetical protein ABK040_015196 [Willaertia magna]